MLRVPLDALLLPGVEFGLTVLYERCPLRMNRGPLRIGLAAGLLLQVRERALQMAQVVSYVGRRPLFGPLVGHPVGEQFPIGCLPVSDFGFIEASGAGGVPPRGPPLRITCGRRLPDRVFCVVVAGQLAVRRDRRGPIDPLLPFARVGGDVAEQVDRPVRRISRSLLTEGLGAFVGGLGGLAGQLTKLLTGLGFRNARGPEAGLSMFDTTASMLVTTIAFMFDPAEAAVQYTGDRPGPFHVPLGRAGQQLGGVVPGELHLPHPLMQQAPLMVALVALVVVFAQPAAKYLVDRGGVRVLRGGAEHVHEERHPLLLVLRGADRLGGGQLGPGVFHRR